MAKFNWDKFKSGELSVILRTKELAEDFYEKCKKHEVDWGTCNYAIWNDYHKEGIVYEFDVSTNSLVWCHTKHITGDSIEWKGENKMEKTFREVIADIKEGEVWESPFAIISCDNFGIEIKFKDRKYSKYCFCDDVKFKLQRKEYTFEEAFKAYEEGKEIESCFSSQKFRIYAWEDVFNAKEIKEKWYIND